MQPLQPLSTTAPSATGAVQTPDAAPTELSEDAKLRFEKMLWAELLVHTGLEKALTLGGGEGASMFSRYFVEAIAADIAEQHPLGLLDSELPSVADAQPTLKGVSDE